MRGIGKHSLELAKVIGYCLEVFFLVVLVMAIFPLFPYFPSGFELVFELWILGFVITFFGLTMLDPFIRNVWRFRKVLPKFKD